MSNKKFKLHFGKVSIILLFVCAALVAVDLILKHFEELQNWNFTVIPGFIWVEAGHRNDGAAFSFMAGNTALLITVAMILLAVMVVCFLFVPDKLVFLKVALTMIIAGAIGNLVDRFVFDGEVRDFVYVNMLFNAPCCNFADFFIVLGVIFAAADCLFFNDWALIPLTVRAKAAQAAEKEQAASDACQTCIENPSDDAADGCNNDDDGSGGQDGDSD